MITNINQLDFNKTYSYADYLTWKFEQTVELIRGKIYWMSPAPKTKHQRVSRYFQHFFFQYFEHRDCEYFNAPFDVRLYDKNKSVQKNEDIYTVVQPDLCVICENSKIDELGCIGAPDLIVEILSPGNSKKEMRTKYDLYQESGVKEYWIADPQHETVQVFFLEGNTYKLIKTWVTDDEMHSHIVPGFSIDLNSIFEKV